MLKSAKLFFLFLLIGILFGICISFVSSATNCGLSTGKIFDSGPTQSVWGMCNDASTSTVSVSLSGYTYSWVCGGETCYARKSLNYSLSDSDGDGLLEIHNCRELQHINQNYSANYELANDIDCSETSWWAPGFTPLNTLYEGTKIFEGNGHTISNLQVSGDTYVGLFGLGCRITNLNLKNVNVTGDLLVGSIVGAGGTIINCSSTGSVRGRIAVGGLAGQGIIIISSSFEGKIIGTGLTDPRGGDEAGGLAGMCSGFIQNSYANVDISGGFKHAGGLVGVGFLNNNVAVISNSYSRGSIVGTDQAGGISSWGSGDLQVFNSYAANTKVYATNGATGSGGLAPDGGQFSSSYWDTQTSWQATSKGGVGKTTSQMKTQSTFVGWDFTNVWGISSSVNDGYPYLRRNTKIQGLCNLNKVYSCFEGQSSNGHTNSTHYVWTCGGLNGGSDTNCAINLAVCGSADGQTFISAPTSNLCSIGTASSVTLSGSTYSWQCHYVPFSRVDCFAYFLDDSNNNTYLDIHDCVELQAIQNNLKLNYELMNDINCSDTRSWNNGAGFNPIGIGSSFSGDFRGNNHAIYNLYINRESTDSVGLFSSLSGNISDLGLTNVDISGKRDTAGIAGISSGSISNSYSTGYIKGGGEVGGIAGSNRGVILYSHSNVIINGTSNDIGGIAGISSGSISNSYSTGTISGPVSFLGGIVGTALRGTISNCYFMGSLSKFVDNSGGLAGGNYYGGNISNSYAVFSENGGDENGDCGGIVDYNVGAVSNSYYNKDTLEYEYSNGGEAKITAQMKTQSNYIGWDFTTIWGMDSSINEGYPYLKAPPQSNNDSFDSILSISSINEEVYLLNLNVSDNHNITASFNITTDVLNCSLNIYNGSAIIISQLNTSIINSSLTNNISVSNLSYGNYSARVLCYFISNTSDESNRLDFVLNESGLKIYGFILNNFSSDNKNLSTNNGSISPVGFSDSSAETIGGTINTGIDSSASISNATGQSVFEKYFWVFIALGVFVLILVVVLVYFIWFKKNNNSVLNNKI